MEEPYGVLYCFYFSPNIEVSLIEFILKHAEKKSVIHPSFPANIFGVITV